MNVCRFCIRWTEYSDSMVDELASLDMIRDMFGLELECGPVFPWHVCDQCCTLLEHSVKFYEQLIDAEKSLQRFREAGMLESLLADPKECGKTLGATDSDDAFYALEEIDDDNALIQPIVGDVFDDFDEQPSRNTKEELVDIRIEAVEELEIVVAPWKEHVATDEQVAHSSSGKRGILDLNSSGQLDEREILVDDEAVYDEHKTGKRCTETTVAQQLQLSNAKEGKVSCKCFICETIFPNATELQTHLLEHEDLLPYHCDQCSTIDHPYDVGTIVCLNNHLESHTFNFVCNQCPLRYRTFATWREHIAAVHSGPHSLTCSLCGKHFTVPRNFIKHMRAHRNKDLQRYKCATCAKVFQTNTVLKRHQLVHLSDSPFKCPHCARGFNNDWNFKAHLRRHKQQGRVYRCQRCDVEFANFLDWRHHMKEHFPEDQRYWTLQDVLPESLHDGTEYPKGCPEPGCTYMATTLRLMWVHYRGHFKAFQCEHCPQKFATPRYLRQHIELVHRGLRPHECTKCGKRFGYRHKLVEHLNMHDGVRNLKCKYCEKRFTHSSVLSAHERKHTDERRNYVCDLCGGEFLTSSSFAKHRGEHDQGKGLRMASKKCVQQQLKRNTGGTVV
uniref:Protein krueppel n=1 Tax=Anopheles atroparvus TaxID=41427 RepID=A0AAG5DYP6_ANOAO